MPDTRPDSDLVVHKMLARQADGDLAGFYDTIRRYIEAGGDPDNVILDLAVMVNGADNTCSICELTPDQSGAQYGLLPVTWGDVHIRICSNCMHGNPVSIVAIDKAASRTRAAMNPSTDTSARGWTAEPTS